MRHGELKHREATMVLDLDGLKQIKIDGRFRHLVGSQALCRLADHSSVRSRKVDTATRFAGDELHLC